MTDHREVHTIEVFNWMKPYTEEHRDTFKVIQFGMYHGDKEIEADVKDFMNDKYSWRYGRKWQRYTGSCMKRLDGIAQYDERYHVCVRNEEGKTIWFGQMYLRRRK